jgi:hypothetical protein
LGNAGKVISRAECLEQYQSIDAEERKLLRQFKGLPKKHTTVVDGLIKRAAFMRLMLESLENDIKANGEFELFTQSDMVEPYQRKRPSVDIYNQTVKNYTNIIRQLTDLLPKAEAKPESDGFDEFVNEK